MKTQQGHTFSEYAFILALVLVFSIAAIALLGGSISDLLGKSGSGVDGYQSASNILAPLDKGGGGEAAPSGKTVAGFGNVSFKTKSGKTISLSNLPTDLSKAVQTAGGNGTTNKIAGQLRNLAKQLQESGEITPEQAASLKKLAQQVARMATIMKMIEDTDASVSSKYGDYLAGVKDFSWGGIADIADAPRTKFIEKNYTLDGKKVDTYTLAQLQLGTDGCCSVFGKMSDDYFQPGIGLNETVKDRFGMFKQGLSEPINSKLLKSGFGVNPEVQTMLDLYNEAKTNGAIKDATVNALVVAQLQEVVAISDGVSRSYLKIHNFEQPVGTITTETASSVGFYDAKAICNIPGANCN